ncbi:MAG: hypothetical protein DCF16_17450 [Alphaproteobacteria bacterium]|nr:MAG: hypothetical protein DCF16_17450 [Alphaproteobacteria bacterium]
MPKLSRRNLIAGAAAAPLALNGAVHAAPAAPRTSPASTPDPVVAKAAAWLADRDSIDAMAEEWSALEVVLFDKVKAMKLSVERGMRSGLPEARAMRVLDRKIKVGLRRLERTARVIVLMRPTSAQGALAKISVGMRIQGPYDWNDDYVYALVQDGCEQLALMLAREG